MSSEQIPAVHGKAKKYCIEVVVIGTQPTVVRLDRQRSTPYFPACAMWLSLSCLLNKNVCFSESFCPRHTRNADACERHYIVNRNLLFSSANSVVVEGDFQTTALTTRSP